MRSSAQADTAREDVKYMRTFIRIVFLHRRSVCDKYQVDGLNNCRKMCFHLPNMVVSLINSLFCLHLSK